jgi:hypothetical protein
MATEPPADVSVPPSSGTPGCSPPTTTPSTPRGYTPPISARQEYNAAAEIHHQARGDLQRRSPLPTYDTGAADQLPELTKRVEAAQRRVQSIDQQIDRLTKDPAITSHHDPQALLQQTKTSWATDQRAASQEAASRISHRVRSARHDPTPISRVDHGPSLGR